MPIYEYKCESCGREKEILHRKIPKRDWRGCDKCKGIMKHVMSVTNHKVEGFSYDNHYGLKGKKDAKKKGSSGPSKRRE